MVPATQTKMEAPNMLKKWFAGLFAAAVLSCGANVLAGEISVDFDQMNFNAKDLVQTVDNAKIPEPVVSSAKQGSKPWWWPWGKKDLTVMVFVNAKNNLESYGLSDVNEMEKIGSTKDVNIVVELGRIKGYTSADGDWTGSRRYLIQKDEDFSKITSPIVQEIAKSDMGDWNYLADFVNWAKKEYPAKRYILVVWNHGSGWAKMGLDDIAFWTRGISYDDETGNHISTVDFGKALALTGKMDIVCMDACLMQMASVVYEIKDNVDVVVASEETEPGDGYDYNLMCKAIVAKPAASTNELSKFIVDAFIESYGSRSVTQSAVNTKAMSGLLSRLGDWTEAVIAAEEKDLADSAKSNVQDFYYSTSKDLRHYVQLVTEGTKNEGLAQKGRELLTFIDQQVIVANGTVGSSYANAYGLAIYMHGWSYNSNYDELSWAVDGKWDEFLKWID